MNKSTTDTPRTDAIEFRHCPPQPEALLKKHNDSYALSRQLERELTETKAEVEFWKAKAHEAEFYEGKHEAEVERLRDLLNKALNEIEKTPFHTPKLTPFTAHRLADRYREKMTNTSTKPIESQEDDK